MHIYCGLQEIAFYLDKEVGISIIEILSIIGGII